MEQKLYRAASRLPEAGLTLDAIQATPVAKARPSGSSRRTISALAACLILLISVGLGTYAYAAEVREYNHAVQFFRDYGLSTAGLTRGEIKAVYRDINTNSFTYSKTADVIEKSLSAQPTGGYEILQESPTPEDVEALWNFKNSAGNLLPPEQEGLHYRYRSEYKMDSQLGFEVFDTSYFELYDGDTLVWSTPLPEFWVSGYCVVSDGVIAYGETDTWSSHQISHAWMAKLDTDGNLIWKQQLDNGFRDESIAAILENADGSYAVFSRGDYQYFCFSQYSAKGKQTLFQQTDVGNYGIWNAACFDDGYLVQLGSYMTNEHARIVKLDRDGSITDSFSYGSQDAYYYITDMIEFDGKIYLSAYTVPRLADEDQNAGGRYEIASILNYLFDNNLWEISSEELTPLVRDNYTAMLLVCDPGAGTPQEFYSVNGSLGGRLSLSDSGTLLWDVESITTTFFSPMTSSFSIGGTCYVFQYTFDPSGQLVHQEKTGQITDYRR